MDSSSQPASPTKFGSLQASESPKRFVQARFEPQKTDNSGVVQKRLPMRNELQKTDNSSFSPPARGPAKSSAPALAEEAISVSQAQVMAVAVVESVVKDVCTVISDDTTNKQANGKASASGVSKSLGGSPQSSGSSPRKSPKTPSAARSPLSAAKNSKSPPSGGKTPSAARSPSSGARNGKSPSSGVSASNGQQSPVSSPSRTMSTPVLCKLDFFGRWVNSLRVWPPLPSAATLADDLRSGILLSRIIEYYLGIRIFHLDTRPAGKANCMRNLEKVIGVIWKQGVKASQMCGPDDIYEGNHTRTWSFLRVLFETLVARHLRDHITTMLTFFDQRLKPFGRQLPPDVLNSASTGSKSGVMKEFADTVRLLVLLVDAEVIPWVHVGHRVYGSPSTSEELRSNAEVLHTWMERCDIPVLFDPMDWQTSVREVPKFDAMMLQLRLIWDRLREASPPRQSSNFADEVGDLNSHFLFRDRVPLVIDGGRSGSP